MKFASLAEIEIIAVAAVTKILTRREKRIVLAEFGKVLSRENYADFTFTFNDIIFFGYAERYLYNRWIHSNVDTFESLKKIDQKLGLYNKEDALFIAFKYFAIDILETSFKVKFIKISIF